MFYDNALAYFKPRVDDPRVDDRVSTHAVPHAGYRPFDVSATRPFSAARGNRWANKIARRRLSRRLAKVRFDRIVRDMEDDV